MRDTILFFFKKKKKAREGREDRYHSGSNIGAMANDALNTFVFPQSEEFATRDYQRNIVTNSLTKNSLVVLPTGLGKTFIAAVIMYNYLRWFPAGKVVFVAPTRPLVNQQIQACHDVVGIKEEETAELNGQVRPNKRQALWQEKRVFYCTPQTVEQDLDNDIMPAKDVVLVVVDEAHRAVGKYAAVKIVQKIYAVQPKFRVLALSATPGKDFNKVQDVVKNLLIQNIEYKSEADIDVKPYVFQKMMDIIQCEMNSECQSVISLFNRFLETPLRVLKSSNMLPMLPGTARELSAHVVATCMNGVGAMGGGLNAAQIMKLRSDLGYLASLVHVRTLLVTHGMSSALNHVKTHFQPESARGMKKNLVNSPEWKMFLNRVEASIQKGGANPKICKLKHLLNEHFDRFKEANQRTSVIVFAQFRDSVNEIVQDLKKTVPHLRVSPFVGQAKSTKGSGTSGKKGRGKGGGDGGDLNNNNEEDEEYGMFFEEGDEENGNEDEEEEDAFQRMMNRGSKKKSNRGRKKANPEDGAAGAATKESVATTGQNQKEQQEVVRKFRNGEIDVLVATCIGEEGLDIGSVDLIISYDALGSPVRMVQRFGRAGRKRSGRIIVLVADEKEKDMLTKGTKQSAQVHKLLRHQIGRFNFFIPPAHACMFPSQNHRPQIQYERLEITKYDLDKVGGQMKRRAPSEVKIGMGPLTEEENELFQQRFGGYVDVDQVERSFDQPPSRALASSDLSEWRYSVAEGRGVNLIKHVVKYVYNEGWQDVVNDQQEYGRRKRKFEAKLQQAAVGVLDDTSFLSMPRLKRQEEEEEEGNKKQELEADVHIAEEDAMFVNVDMGSENQNVSNAENDDGGVDDGIPIPPNEQEWIEKYRDQLVLLPKKEEHQPIPQPDKKNMAVDENVSTLNHPVVEEDSPSPVKRSKKRAMDRNELVEEEEEEEKEQDQNRVEEQNKKKRVLRAGEMLHPDHPMETKIDKEKDKKKKKKKQSLGEEGKRRKREVKNALFHTEAEQEEHGPLASDDEADDSDLDENLQGFVVGSQEDDGVDSPEGGHEAFHARLLQQQSSPPANGATLLRNPRQKSRVAMPVIERTLAKIQRSRDLGVPLSEDEDDDIVKFDEEEEEEEEGESYDSHSQGDSSSFQSSAEKTPFPSKSGPSEVVPISVHKTPLPQPVFSPVESIKRQEAARIPPQPPSASSIPPLQGGNQSKADEVKRMIEEKKRQAMEKLKLRQQQQSFPPPAQPQPKPLPFSSGTPGPPPASAVLNRGHANHASSENNLAQLLAPKAPPLRGVIPPIPARNMMSSSSSSSQHSQSVPRPFPAAPPPSSGTATFPTTQPRVPPSAARMTATAATTTMPSNNAAGSMQQNDIQRKIEEKKRQALEKLKMRQQQQQQQQQQGNQTMYHQ